MPTDAETTGLFEALNVASLAVSRARTAEEVYPAAAEALYALGIHVNIFSVKDETSVQLEHLTYAEELTSAVEKLLGVSRKLTVRTDQVPLFGDIIRSGQARYVSSTSEVLAHIVPGGSSALARTAVRMLGVGRLIGAPILSDGEISGLLFVMSNELSEAQVPAMEAFAHLLGNTVSRIALLAQLRKSLSALKTTQDQLVQTQKTEAIGRLTAGIAHDFNNLLTPMVWSVETLEEAGLEPDNEALATLRHMLSSATRLTQQLLAFGRRQVLQPTRVDLNEVTERAADLLQRILGEDVRVQVELCPDPVIVRADESQIEQILINLAVNARDALEPGGRVVLKTRALSAQPTEEATASAPERACLSVEDDGAGMTAEVRERAFEPFYTTKGPGAGSGLGLSVVQGIVAQHGGRLELDSREGHGTRVDIYLPRYEGAEPSVVPAASKSSGLDVETAWVLEDRPEVRRVLVRSLQRYGIEVSEAADLNEARALLADAPLPQLLISDIVLPDGTGLDFVAEVRAAAPAVAIIVVSGHPLQDDRAERMERISDAYLAKPFTQKGLADAVRSAVAAADLR